MCRCQIADVYRRRVSFSDSASFLMYAFRTHRTRRRYSLPGTSRITAPSRPPRNVTDMMSTMCVCSRRARNKCSRRIEAKGPIICSSTKYREGSYSVMRLVEVNTQRCLERISISSLKRRSLRPESTRTRSPSQPRVLWIGDAKSSMRPGDGSVRPRRTFCRFHACSSVSTTSSSGTVGSRWAWPLSRCTDWTVTRSTSTHPRPHLVIDITRAGGYISN